MASLNIMSVVSLQPAGTTKMFFVSSCCLYVERGGLYMKMFYLLFYCVDK
jgi:hypothetical protein